jgi:hypothetical protein
MKIKNLIVISILLAGRFYSQSDTSLVHPDKLVENPIFFGFQIEAVSALVINEAGISGDYDFYSSTNRKYNFGLRISTEYYKISSFNVGGGSTYGPYWDLSLLGRHSLRGRYFWFSPLLGISLHNIHPEENSDSKLILKWGLELKYNLYHENIGLVLKFLTGSTDNSGYGGIGITIGFYNE